MKHYYATGNKGAGTKAYAFETKKERDQFVAWNTAYDNRRAITRQHVRRYYSKTAYVLKNGDLVPDGYGPKTIDI